MELAALRWRRLLFLRCLSHEPHFHFYSVNSSHTLPCPPSPHLFLAVSWPLHTSLYQPRVKGLAPSQANKPLSGKTGPRFLPWKA